MTHILIVDDDELIADSLSYSLKLEGYVTRSVGLGAQALDAISAFSPDLVVLDLNLPDINGMEICRQMRIHSTIPVIMLTARDDEIDRVMGLEIGADDYLTKPFAFRELLARIRALLRRVQFDQQEQIPTLITIGMITLDIKARRILRSNREVEVSAREFDLLELLMKNAGTALSREQLLDLVWGRDWVGDHRTLNVHVRWLRVKLEEDPASPHLIQTVRGYGYRFAGPEELA